MKKVISWLKSANIGKIFTVFAAGILLFVSTACNSVQAKTADQPKTADRVREEVPSGAITNEYKGGMNSYSNVDPRFDESGSRAKAKQLIDKTERQVIDMTDDVGTNTKRILDKKGENAEHFNQNVKISSDRAGDKAKDSAKDFAEGTRKGTQNIKENTRNAGDDAALKNSGNGVLSGVKNAIDNVTNANDY